MRGRGTLQTDQKPICAQCCHAAVAHRSRSNEYIVYCQEFKRMVPLDIDSCTTFAPIGAARFNWGQPGNLSELYEVIDPRPKPGRYL